LFEFYVVGEVYDVVPCAKTKVTSEFTGDVNCEYMRQEIHDGENRTVYRCTNTCTHPGANHKCRLGPNTRLFVDGDCNGDTYVNVHTSCSVTFGPNCVFMNSATEVHITYAESLFGEKPNCGCGLDPVCGDGLTEDREECDAGSAAEIDAQDKSGYWCDEDCHEHYGPGTDSPACECKGKVSYLNFDWDGEEIATFTGRKTGDLNLEKLEDGTYSLRPTGGETVWTSTLGVNIYAFAAGVDTANKDNALVTVHTSCSVRIGAGCKFHGPGGTLTVLSGTSLLAGELCDYADVPDTCDYNF